MTNEQTIINKKSQLARLEFTKKHLLQTISVKLNCSDVSNTFQILKTETEDGRVCQLEEVPVDGLGELTDEYIHNSVSLVSIKINELKHEIEQLQPFQSPTSKL